MSGDEIDIERAEDEDEAELDIKVRNVFVHGQNLSQKEVSKKKYTDDDSRAMLLEIRSRYNDWNAANDALKGPFATPGKADEVTIKDRVRLLTEYKLFLDQQRYAENFDSRSNLHSSVLEEFIYYLFRDLVADFPGRPLIGKSHTFKDLFFFPGGYHEMLTQPHARIEKKDHDFVIGASINAQFRCADTKIVENNTFELPAIAIECKTYLDKTMLEGSSSAAEQLKYRSPNALYIVVAEWLKLTSAVNLKKYKVDQIYILRRQKNTDREYRHLPEYEMKPIDPNVVRRLYEQVRAHLTGPWGGGVEEGLERGWLI